MQNITISNVSTLFYQDHTLLVILQIFCLMLTKIFVGVQYATI
jgi:hypothetical protein